MKFIKQPDSFVVPGYEDTYSPPSTHVSEMMLAVRPELGVPTQSLSDVYLTEDGEVWVGRYRVMYGYRLRAGFIGDDVYGCEVDICCGSDPIAYENARDVVMKAILYNKENGDDVFKDIPDKSKVKPYTLDADFVFRMMHLAMKVFVD